MVTVTDPHSNPTDDSLGTGPPADTEIQMIANPTDPNAINQEQAPQGSQRNYADAASSSTPLQEINSRTLYVEIDVTNCRDCYEVANIRNAQIIHAIESQFPSDDTRRTRALKGRDNGKWKITTGNINLYRGIDLLYQSGEKLATVQIKSEERRVDQLGNVTFVRRYENKTGGRESEDGEELLITLVGADSPRFQHVGDAELVKQIIDMDVGRIKIPLRRQAHKNSSELTGNKYFVLKDLQPGDKERLPDSFNFWDEHSGAQRMFLSWNGKRRKCSACQQFHEGECDMMTLIRKLEGERETAKKANDDHLPIKTYAPSTLRLACQGSLASDVDCMSGATTGNILNAMEIDPSSAPINVLITGQNDLHLNMSTDEFLWSLKKSSERLSEMAKQKVIAIVPPPKQNPTLAEPKIKEEVFLEHLQQLAVNNENVHVWQNPVEEYTEDNGQHPSVEETEQLLRFIDEQAKAVFETPYMLSSATSQTLTTTAKYSKVRSLYKYGCSGCNQKTKNRWYNLCDQCKISIREDGDIQQAVEGFNDRVNKFLEEHSPTLEHLSFDSAEEDFSCPHCGREFQSGAEIRQHFNDNHPEAAIPDARELRKKHKFTPHNDDGRNRRDKAFKPLY